MSKLKKKEKINKSLEKYFLERCEKAGLVVVPGHIPNFKNKDDIDKWIEVIGKSFDIYFKED